MLAAKVKHAPVMIKFQIVYILNVTLFCELVCNPELDLKTQ